MKTIFLKEIPTLIPREQSPYAHKLSKKIILVGSTSKCSDSRKTETLCKIVGTLTKGSEYFRNCEGMLNSFSFSTPATAVTRRNSSQTKRKICSGKGDWKFLKEELKPKQQLLLKTILFCHKTK